MQHPASEPYYAVIFSSQRNDIGQEEYEAMAAKMFESVQSQPGFIGMESARNPDGSGITVSYWKSLEDIKAWKAHGEHRLAQRIGHTKWYDSFTTRICRVEREYRK
jgi:heme-degrading monooxygenase HmoA